jgi:hypothetical protein
MTARKSKAAAKRAKRHRGAVKRSVVRKVLKELPTIWATRPGVDELIAEADRGNTEPLARYIEALIPDEADFPRELQTHYAKLVRAMPSPGHRPKSYPAFRNSRRRAWFMARCRRDGDSPEAAYRKAEEEFAASRRTLVRDWAQNSDLHNPHWVDLLSIDDPYIRYFEHLT